VRQQTQLASSGGKRSAPLWGGNLKATCSARGYLLRILLYTNSEPGPVFGGQATLSLLFATLRAQAILRFFLSCRVFINIKIRN